MKYEITIHATKYVELEANSLEEAKEKANELPLDVDDFTWEIDGEKIE